MFSLTGGRVCRLQLLRALASVVLLGSESCGTRDHILLSHIRDFFFRRLLRLARLRWRYSTPSSYSIQSITQECLLFYNSRRTDERSLHPTIRLLLRLFITAETCLPKCCPAMVIFFTISSVSRQHIHLL
jgi:hypothetical protein